MKNVKVIGVFEFDKLVTETYNRTYSFQQQDGCKERGIEYFKVPDYADDFTNDTVPEIVNGPEMGVSFKAWLERDPKQFLNDNEKSYDKEGDLELWWERNFYPDTQMVLNDLYEKGLLEAGDYGIDIDW